MNITETLQKAGALDLKRVYGEPIEKDGTTIVLAASVRGGGGGGEGEAPEGKASGSGSGLGFGFGARPAGAFVVREGKVRWMPAVDATRIVVGGQLLLAVGLLVLRSILRGKSHVAAHRSWRHRLAHH